jgi:tetraacyldisaccharide 4'-kinase
MTGHRPTQVPATRDSRSSWLAIISGENRGVGATTARAGLWLLSCLYRVGLAVSNLRFRLPGGIRRAAIPVVSIGNLTVGGTGKTPMVALVARLVKESGRPCAIFSRGYGSQAGGPNEEALELARLCPGALVLQNPDRLQAIEPWAAANPGGVAILDDGFQHRRLARDLDVVLIDATVPFGHGHVLPRGLLREPLSALRRASLLIVTRADQVAAAELERLKQDLARRVQGRVPILVAEHRPTQLFLLDGTSQELARLRGQPIAAACGIGNPTAFRRTLENLGADVRVFRSYPDHHAYTLDDLNTLLAACEAAGVKTLVTTGKDLVKWQSLLGKTIPPGAIVVAAVEIALVMTEGEEVVRQALKALPGAHV